MAGRKSDALLKRLLEKIVWPEEKFDRIIGLLEQISAKLVAVEIPPGVVTVQLTAPALEELREVFVTATETYGALKLADDLYVEKIDLRAKRTKVDYSSTLALPGTIALTIFRCLGIFDLYLQKADEAHKITFTAISWPQTFLLDWFKLAKVYITNEEQATIVDPVIIIAWRRTS